MYDAPSTALPETVEKAAMRNRERMAAEENERATARGAAALRARLGTDYVAGGDHPNDVWITPEEAARLVLGAQ